MRLDNTEQVLTTMNEQLGQVRGRLDKGDGRFNQIDERFDKVDERFDKVESDVLRGGHHNQRQTDESRPGHDPLLGARPPIHAGSAR